MIVNLVFSTRFIKMEYQVFHLLYIAFFYEYFKNALKQNHYNQFLIYQKKTLIYDYLFRWSIQIKPWYMNTYIFE